MPSLNSLPFQYLLRGDDLAQLSGQLLAAAYEQRDRELEDWIGQRPSTIVAGPGIKVDNTDPTHPVVSIAAPAWTALTGFTNSWTAFGAPQALPGWRQIGDIVYMRGVINNGTMGLAAFTLPVGIRPPYPQNRPSVGGSNTPITININASGVVTPQLNSTVAFDPALAKNFIVLDTYWSMTP